MVDVMFRKTLKKPRPANVPLIVTIILLTVINIAQLLSSLKDCTATAQSQQIKTAIKKKFNDNPNYFDYNGTITHTNNCYVNSSLLARHKWLTNDDEEEVGGGYVMIHHVRRAGGTTLCGILADGDEELLKCNCLIYPSEIAGRGSELYSLKKFHSVSDLEAEMIRQGNRKIVAVEGFELPTWFLNDPDRSKRWTIITSIRDPVDRLVSISRLKCPNDPNRCWSRSTDVATGFPLNNVMVRMFAGGSATTKNMRLSNYKITEKDLSTAIHVLESQYQFIIITEWLPEMAPIFKYWFGLEESSSRGLKRRGQGGSHAKEELSLGSRQKAVQHYVDSSSSKVFLVETNYGINNGIEIYNKFKSEHEFDRRLVEHFKQRERHRALNCFLFRYTNLPQLKDTTMK